MALMGGSAGHKGEARALRILTARACPSLRPVLSEPSCPQRVTRTFWRAPLRGCGSSLTGHWDLGAEGEGGPAAPEALYVETTGRPRPHAAPRASLSLGFDFSFLIKQVDLSCGCGAV